MRPNPYQPMSMSRQSLNNKQLYGVLFAENAFDESNLLHVYTIIIIKWRIIQYKH